MSTTPEPALRPDAELYVLLRKAGVDRHEAQALIDAHAEHARAAVLRERADFFEGVLRDSLDPDSDPRYYTAIHDVVLGLRRLATETAAGSGGQAEDGAQR